MVTASRWLLVSLFITYPPRMLVSGHATSSERAAENSRRGAWLRRRTSDGRR